MGQDKPDDTISSGPDVVEAIVAELRKRRTFLQQLNWPGKLVIHVKPNSEEPIVLEAQVKL